MGSPKDIALAAAEELTGSSKGRKVRYVASEDQLSCDAIAKEVGLAIGKPYLKWALMSDKDMLSGLKMFGVSQSNAEGIVEMNAAIHSGLLDEDYYRNRPVLGKVKLKEFAQEFAAAYNL